MIYAMCQTYLNLYYSPTTQIYSVLAPAYMTYETLSIGSWLNCLCGSRLIWLSLNLGKTNYMLFRSRPPDNELALPINNVVLPRVAATKFLGIIIDDKLSWKPHIQSVKSKLSSVLSIMYKASQLINTSGMYTLYCSLFHPYLSYCNEIWGNTYPSNVKCLFTLQTKAIRLICNADRLAHINAMFKDMSILKLSEFVKHKTAIVMVNGVPSLLMHQMALVRNSDIHH